MSTMHSPEPRQPAGSDSDFALVAAPLFPSDVPKIGDFWLDGRMHSTAAGIAYLAHNDREIPVILVHLSQGSSLDKNARDRFSGEINKMHIDDVVARGGHEQDQGRLGRKFRGEGDDPVEPHDAPLAPWVALAFDGTPRAADQAKRLLAEVELSDLAPIGTPAGPDYRHYWIDRIRPGLSRLWPLPWPGRYDRAGWVTVLISWLIMLALATIAVLLAIFLFRSLPPEAPPPPVPATGSGAGQSGSASGQPTSGSGSAAASASASSSGQGQPSSAQSSSGAPSPGQSSQTVSAEPSDGPSPEVNAPPPPRRRL